LKTKALAPLDGTEIGEKTSRVLGFFDFSSREIPPKRSLLNGGYYSTLSDDSACRSACLFGRNFVPWFATNPLCRPVAPSDVRGLLGRSRRPPIRGQTSAVPRHGLPCVGCLKQLPKPVCQLFDGLPQGAELPNPDYGDGSVQVKRWGTQYFHGIDRTIPGNKASG